MAFRRVVPAVLALALLASGCSSNEGAAGARLPSNPYALPSFDLASYQRMLSGLRGMPAVVNIWASWCGPCRKEAPLLASAHETHGDRVQFVGVDILDERGSARAFMHEFDWTYPSVFDPSGAIRDGLGLLGQPVTLFYDRSGKLIDTWSGPLSEDALAERLKRITPTASG